LSALALSMTTSASACGGRPVTRLKGLSASTVPQSAPTGAQGRVADRLALLVDELGVADDDALGGPDAWDGGDGGYQGGLDPGTLGTEVG